MSNRRPKMELFPDAIPGGEGTLRPGVPYCRQCGRPEPECLCNEAFAEEYDETGTCPNMNRDGYCNLVGSEYCDWVCPFNDYLMNQPHG